MRIHHGPCQRGLRSHLEVIRNGGVEWQLTGKRIGLKRRWHKSRNLESVSTRKDNFNKILDSFLFLVEDRAGLRAIDCAGRELISTMAIDQSLLQKLESEGFVEIEAPLAGTGELVPRHI